MIEIFIEFFVPQIYLVFHVFVINSIVSFLIAHGKADLGKVMDRLKAATGERAVLDAQCSALIVTLLYHPLIVVWVVAFGPFVKCLKPVSGNVLLFWCVFFFISIYCFSFYFRVANLYSSKIIAVTNLW